MHIAHAVCIGLIEIDPQQVFFTCIADPDPGRILLVWLDPTLFS